MFLQKLDYLMERKGINKSILAKESGIPYTTIDGFYKKGYENAKLSTIKKLASYFDVSIDFLMNDKILDTNYGKESAVPYTPHEQAVMTAYRNQPEMQPAVDKLLGVPAEEETVRVYMAAKSDNDEKDGVREIPRSVMDKLRKAPTAEEI